MALHSPLVWIKLLHTLIWAFMASCICGLPLMTARRRFRAVLVLSVIVLLECGILALNHFRCPVTDLAARYTSDRSANFDIYLPRWLARNNQRVFGTIFAVAEVFCIWKWISVKGRTLPTAPRGTPENPPAHTLAE